VSSAEIDDVVATMMEHEVHGKLTGAGGGGCVIGFPKDPKALLVGGKDCRFFKLLESKGYTVYSDIQVEETGFRVDI